MSHQPERTDKDCLNCGAEVLGPYCQKCGQKNIVVHQSFGQLTTHFIYDIFHFDGKFFDTLKHLLFKPGHVPREYVRGKRFSYLDPIRMYLFTSALFFLVFYSISKINDVSWTDENRFMSKEERFEAIADVYALRTNNAGDTTVEKKMALLLDTTKAVLFQKVDDDTLVRDSSNIIFFRKKAYFIYPKTDTIDIDGSSAENAWIETRLNNRWRLYKKQYGDDINKIFIDISNRFLHWFPYMLFVSLPLFALILKLLYLRRKQFYYSDHAVFTLYHYIFSFILLLFYWALQTLDEKMGWSWLNILQTLLLISWPVYLFIALRRFYGQGRGKTFIKFLLVNFLGFVSLLLIFICFSIIFLLQL